MIAEHGLEQACRDSPPIRKGVNLYRGECVYPNVAADLDIDYTPLKSCVYPNVAADLDIDYTPLKSLMENFKCD
jgi:hypothetical protein